jgi:hypothetical protein
MRLPPHRIEQERRLVPALRSLERHLRRLYLVKVNFLRHGIQEVRRLKIMQSAYTIGNSGRQI